ncbi:TPA: hypothetical protein HA251_05405 [Candidatus Woesearchaeota archaeon]|nr:hypothetical protein [Candidatus Woesearchaeota archaeon]
METRKAQKVATGTLTISLPKPWVDKHRVKQGSTLTLQETSAGHLIIMQHGPAAIREPAHLSEPLLLEESIISTYILGEERVIIDAATPSLRARTMTVLHYLPGFEIASEDAKTITLRCLLDEQNLRLYPLLDRLCVLLEHGAKLAVTGDLAALRQNEHEIDRVYHLCQRILARATQEAVFLEHAGIPSVRSIPAFQLLVKRLEHAGDAIDDIRTISSVHAKSLFAIVGIIVTLVRTFTAGKLNAQRLAVRSQIASIMRPDAPAELHFLAKTAEDIREELVQLYLGMTTLAER